MTWVAVALMIAGFGLEATGIVLVALDLLGAGRRAQELLRENKLVQVTSREARLAASAGAGRAICTWGRQPLGDKAVERFVHLPLDSHRDEIAVGCFREHEQVCLRRPSAAGQRDPVLKNAKEHLQAMEELEGAAFKRLSNRRRKVVGAHPAVGECFRRESGAPLLGVDHLGAPACLPSSAITSQ